MRENPLSILLEEERSSSESESSMPATLADLNRVIHEPARLAILTVLSGCLSTDFTFLQTATGLSKGNLSVQLTRLEEAGLVEITKTIVRKRTLTMVSLTKEGRSELARYWRQMERIRTHAARMVEAVALKVERGSGVVVSEEILSS